MPVSPKRLQKTTRAVSAVQRLSVGQSVTGAARSLGVTRRTVHRDLADPTTQALVSRLIAQNEERLHELFGRSLEVCSQAMEATVRVPVGEKKKSGHPIVEERPDIETRLKGVDRFADLAQLVLRHLPPADPQQRGTLTWENFQQIYLAKLEELKARRENDTSLGRSRTSSNRH